METYKEQWTGKVLEVTIGATAAEGGTRVAAVRIGGETTLPFYLFEGEMPHMPVIAMEIFDRPPHDAPGALAEVFSDVWDDAARWAEKCVASFGAEMICLNLISTKPDEEDSGPGEARETVRRVLGAVKVPLVIRGPGVAEKDNLIIPAVSEEAKGERVLLGAAVQENYREAVRTALANGHCLIAESPIDINIAKQTNILLGDEGLPLDRVVMDPTTGGLGYGLEYTYSIMERARIAALGGDRVLGCPFVNFVGYEAWHAKEAKADNPQWGERNRRGALWEAMTALAFLQAGSDLLVMHHPAAVSLVRKAILDLRGGTSTR
ncbi:MAG: CO dehydrogenase/acetyl-CoA synthase subunit delta [Candidatus Eremiobacteraeota bacterium]|nr:CO dehydrogenase/acetyl-CoA synthase subunit delta [Candidatus Eremiobacteraeota bacterium]